MVDPALDPLIDEARQYGLNVEELCRELGRIIDETQIHDEPLGISVSRWPREDDIAAENEFDNEEITLPKYVIHVLIGKQNYEPIWSFIVELHDKVTRRSAGATPTDSVRVFLILLAVLTREDHDFPSLEQLLSSIEVCRKGKSPPPYIQGIRAQLSRKVGALKSKRSKARLKLDRSQVEIFAQQYVSKKSTKHGLIKAVSHKFQVTPKTASKHLHEWDILR